MLDHLQRMNIEMNRRLSVCVFTLDKMLSTKLQHPPALGLSYVAFAMPFGLPDEQLFTSNPENRQSVNEGSTSWDGAPLSPSTYLRGFMLSSQIRDEILAVSWGGRKLCNIQQYKLVNMEKPLLA
jgi:hypothetical protein